MTFVSLADACRRLSIDAKTVHRWLAQAQLPLQSHPVDGRKKGMSQEHLQKLAHLHQRSLTSLPQVPSPLVKSEVPELSAAQLAFPEQLSTLQAQISVLQQQMADLSLLLLHQAHPPVSPVAPVQQSKTSKRPSKPAPPAPSSRPASKAPRKSVQVIPRVEYGQEGHYVVTCPKHGVLPFEPDTPAWFAWVRAQSSFRFVGRLGRFTAHHEGRVLRGAWRAHRHIRNHSYTLRLAKSHELTIAVLEQAAEALQAHLN